MKIKTPGVCECGCGGVVLGKRYIKNHYQRSDKARNVIIQKNTGHKRTLKHGESVLRKEHLNFKKDKCVFGCESKSVDLHHEPHLNSTLSKTWSGKLITVCPKCHRNIHNLTIPDGVGVEWSIEQTTELLKNT